MRSEDIVQCFCIWSDLLGFGDAFREGNWSFEKEPARRNIERLRNLESCLYRSNDPRKEVALVLNDGLARVYDLPDSDQQVGELLWWLHSALSNHWFVNANDAQRDWPGMRSVISYGERIASLPNQTTWGDHFMGDSPLKRLADNRVCIYSPREFQMNLAFSKAYIIESYGSKAGLVGAGLFIDACALDAMQKIINACSVESIGWELTTDSPSAERSILHRSSVTYTANRKTNDDFVRFEVSSSYNQLTEIAIAIDFDKEPIKFNECGINTLLFEVKRYKPLDEKAPFHFDFSNYTFG